MKKTIKVNIRQINFPALLWASLIFVVVLTGLYYLPLEYQGLEFWEALYTTLRLFVFEHDGPFPKSTPLIIIFFAAPLITASAIGTYINYLFRLSPSLRLFWISGHVVICGMGRTGRLLTKALKEKKIKVVGVDLGPSENFEDFCAEHGVPMVYGNFNSKHILLRAAVLRAHSIIFTSGDDIQNLSSAVGVYEQIESKKHSVRMIWTHIANERLADTASLALHTEGETRIHIFDTYRIAATRMIDTYFSQTKRKGLSEVTILGFGKFGRDLMEVLMTDISSDETFSICVVDILDKRREVFSLAEEVGIIDRVSFTQADIREVELVNQKDKAFFLCTDDDLSNLSEALILASKVDASQIYVRMAHWPMSIVADHIGNERGIAFVNINDLVVKGIHELPGIFEAR